MIKEEAITIMECMPILLSIAVVVGLGLFIAFIIGYKKCNKKEEISRKYFIKQIISTGIFAAASATTLFILNNPIETEPIASYINGLNNALILCIPFVAILIFVNYAKHVLNYY